MTARGRFLGGVLLVLALVAVVVVLGLHLVGRPDVEERAGGSPAPEEVVRHFYRGLAHLQVGRTDAAAEEFHLAAQLAPGEPASWANLALAHLRLGDFDAGSDALARAAELAPESGPVAFLEAQLALATGQREVGIESLRRAVELDPGNLPARMALVQEVEASGQPGADAEAQRLLEEILALQPENAAVLVERARLAAKREDGELLRDTVERLGRLAIEWPESVVEQYRSLASAAAADELAVASRRTAFLRNVLVQVPTFLDQRRLVTPAPELVGQPFTRFLVFASPPAAPAPPDLELTFDRREIGEGNPASWAALLAISLDGEQAPAVFAAGGRELRRVDAAGEALAFPGGAGQAQPPAGLAAVDWNFDFRMDLLAAGAGGVRLFLQTEEGSFADATPDTEGEGGLGVLDATGVWAADVEMDGDMDAVVGVSDGDPVVLQNNGDGTWQPLRPFPGVSGLREWAWGDLDGDGDPDAALLDGAGTLHVFANLQSGSFERLPPPEAASGIGAIALGDTDSDGVLELVTLADGTVRRAWLTAAGWQEAEWASLSAGGSPPADADRLLLGDLDNNGALDLVAAGPAGASVWLADETWALEPLDVQLAAQVWSMLDLDGDGALDLVGLAEGRPVRFLGRPTRGYHFHAVGPRAQRALGDQRINSFGIGGTIEARAGRLVQKRAITGSSVHFGLGQRPEVDVTWIVWPNGVAQAEFDLEADRTVVAQQRLKGSCPWVFADDGTGLRFVTDFLWRSPLGLRINAHDTAGVVQTEDWVRIRGDQLAARNGVYDVRITAELWETHFVDHVSLLAVDHPEDVEVLVDERFVPAAPPELAVHAMERPRPVARAWDQDGRDVTDLVAQRDGRFLDTFERGRYQGIAEDHFVEVELGAPVPAGEPAWLVAHGWIYPTDSSINLAIGQGGGVRPRGLSLEARTPDGRWSVAAEDLGFPAGKSKTVLIDLGLLETAGLGGATRLRLRTNLEIYWDSLAFARARPDAPLTVRRVSPSGAELRYRGFSVTELRSRELPELPVYDRIANTMPRWRDLVGFYTRFGDVRELLAEVEERYVIMNAGDELRLTFPAPPAPAPGLARDFVLIGDGWVKDGDFNTSHSKTVHPLPVHGRQDYGAGSAHPLLVEDPVFARHAEDWTTYHTRFVEPRAFLEGLQLTGAPRRP